jgi:predicted nucleotidyltransferase component of viral defense system
LFCSPDKAGRIRIQAKKESRFSQDLWLGYDHQYYFQQMDSRNLNATEASFSHVSFYESHVEYQNWNHANYEEHKIAKTVLLPIRKL